jgi:hypothetical protein
MLKENYKKELIMSTYINHHQKLGGGGRELVGR